MSERNTLAEALRLPLSKEEIALRIFCALLSNPNAKISIHPDLGDNEIRVSFSLAKTFMKIHNEE
jgi:hypothetical protein